MSFDPIRRVVRQLAFQGHVPTSNAPASARWRVVLRGGADRDLLQVLAHRCHLIREPSRHRKALLCCAEEFALALVMYVMSGEPTYVLSTDV